MKSCEKTVDIMICWWPLGKRNAPKWDQQPLNVHTKWCMAVEMVQTLTISLVLCRAPHSACTGGAVGSAFAAASDR